MYTACYHMKHMEAQRMGQLNLSTQGRDGRRQKASVWGKRRSWPKNTATAEEGIGGITCDHKRHKMKLNGYARPRFPGHCMTGQAWVLILS